jgi:hypothetical protein
VAFKPALLTVLTITLTFSTVETHQVYAVNNMEPLTLSCLWNGHINLMFINGVDPYITYIMDTFSIRCLQCGTIKLMLFTVWAYEASVSYNMD